MDVYSRVEDFVDQLQERVIHQLLFILLPTYELSVSLSYSDRQSTIFETIGTWKMSKQLVIVELLNLVSSLSLVDSSIDRLLLAVVACGRLILLYLRRAEGRYFVHLEVKNVVFGIVLHVSVVDDCITCQYDVVRREVQAVLASKLELSP